MSDFQLLCDSQMTRNVRKHPRSVQPSTGVKSKHFERPFECKKAHNKDSKRKVNLGNANLSIAVLEGLSALKEEPDLLQLVITGDKALVYE